MHIVPASVSDWSTIAALLQQASLPVDDLDSSHLDNFLVARSAEINSEIAGAIGLECFGDTGLLRSLVVADAHRGAGVARKLIAALEARAIGIGIESLYLLTIDADEYFLARGYLPVERPNVPASIRATREFSELCPGDAVVMRKALGGAPTIAR